MLRTYKAVLRGNRVEWLDVPPPAARPTAVHITLLEDEAAESPTLRGQAMAGALEALAATGGLSWISDPSAWQRDVRQERALPGRED